MAWLQADLPDDLKKKLDLFCRERDLSLKEGVTRAVVVWMEGVEPIVRCPVCETELKISGQHVSLTGGEPETENLKLPTKIAKFVRSFLRLVSDPTKKLFRRWIEEFIDEYENPEKYRGR